jgi:hypothetical protein
MIKVGNLEECINPDCPAKKKAARTAKAPAKKKPASE